MVSNELLEEVIFVSKHNKLIGKDLILKIIMYNIYTADPITQNKFNSLCFSEKINTLGLCNTRSGDITINLNECYKDVLELRNTTTLQKNLELICNILHEIEHLKESYKISLNDFEGKLLKIADAADNYSDSEEAIFAYISNPSERIANAMPLKNILNNIKRYPNFDRELFYGYKHINNRYLEELKFGYIKISPDKYNIPLVFFLKHIKKLNYLKNESLKLCFKNEIKSGNIDLEKKFMYGLKVTLDEVKELDKRKILTRKGDIYDK